MVSSPIENPVLPVAWRSGRFPIHQISTARRSAIQHNEEMATTDRGQITLDGTTVSVTNLGKILYPESGTTKAEVIDYYTRIAAVMLPHVVGRPGTRKRWPNGVDGQSFFEKNLASSAPRSGSRVRRCNILIVSSLTRSSIPLHPWRGWGSRPHSNCTFPPNGDSTVPSVVRRHDWYSISTRAKASG